MARCRVDKSIDRVSVEGFDFPLGVYPVEPMHPREGYTTAFEPADGGEGDGPGPDDDGDSWDEWPDRYVWDVVLKASRLEPFCRSLFAAFAGRIYPILDVLGNDAFREVDPYVSYELVGQERFLEGVRRFRGYLFEDGLVGFGAMSEEPFLYVFIDEHKIVTIRAEAALKDKVESILAAFDLTQVDTLAGADAALHEHRGVLDAPADRPDLLTSEEIVEELRDAWGLELNIDPKANVDDQGAELGITGWRAVVRILEPDGQVRYLEMLLTAGSLMDAHDLAYEEAEERVAEENDAKTKSKEGNDPKPGTLPSADAPGRPGRGSPSPRAGRLDPPRPRPARDDDDLPDGPGFESDEHDDEPDATDPDEAGPDGPPKGPGSAARGGGPGAALPDRGFQDLDDLQDEDELSTIDVVVADRLTAEDFRKTVEEAISKTPDMNESRVWASRWPE